VVPRLAGLLGLLLVAGLLAPAVSAGSLAGRTDPATGITETVLPSGLKVLTKELRTAPVVTVWTWYRVGSRNERPGATGMSHLLEHMMFRATTSLKTGEIDRLVQGAGGRHNAFTGYDATAYHITLPSDRLEVALRIEADRMQNCLLDVEDVTREKGVVISELQGRLNDPEELLENAVRTAAFRAHPYGSPIIGRKEDVESIRQEAILDYYRTHYQPNNAVLVIVGDFETAEALTLVEKYYAAMVPAPPPPGVNRDEPPQEGERRVSMASPGGTGLLEFLYRLPPGSHPDLAALEVLETLLTDGKSSRLHRALVEAELAASQSGFLSRRLDPGWIAFYFAAREGRPHAVIEAAFLGEIARLQAEPPSQSELEKAINKVRARHIIEHGSASGLALAIGTLETTLGYRAMGDYLTRVRAVTAPDIRRVARAYLTPGSRTTGWLVPEAAPRGSGPAEAETPRDVTHRSEPLDPPGPFPGRSAAGAAGLVAPTGDRVRRTVLDNGLTLIAVEHRAPKAVAIQGYVLAGPVIEPPGKAGLAFLTADLLARGSATRPGRLLDEWLDSLGATAEFRSGYETVGFQARMLSEHFETVLDYLADCLRNPTFPADEVTKAAGRLRARLGRDAEEIKDRAHRELFARLYPSDHPLHRHPRGRLADLPGITREDLVAFHDRHYRPDRTVLVIVGDRTPEEMLAQVRRAFGGWSRSEVPPPDMRPPMPRVARTVRHTVTLPGKAEAFVMLGGNGISRDHPDYYPAFLAARILGGGLGSRLMRVLRDEGGMTYGAHSYFHPFLGERPWIISMQAAPQNVDRAVAVALAEARRLRDTGVDAEELAMAKASAIGLLALSLEDQEGQAFVLRDAELFSLGSDFPRRYVEAIRALTAEQVQSAARTYLDPDRMIQVVVTPPPAP
jgi:zinc protease